MLVIVEALSVLGVKIGGWNAYQRTTSLTERTKKLELDLQGEM